ncbi:MAG: amidohydrolase family protein, partial [Deltaproteobacteria bacterium]|nr:amidohydrolase family protein [Deltaproteobacteria bacterium]
SPMDAIVISTRNGAELLGMEKELGTLEQSKLADILVVDGDPLTDLGALRDVHLVFLGGKMMVRDGLVL